MRLAPSGEGMKGMLSFFVDYNITTKNAYTYFQLRYDCPYVRMRT